MWLVTFTRREFVCWFVLSYRSQIGVFWLESWSEDSLDPQSLLFSFRSRLESVPAMSQTTLVSGGRKTSLFLHHVSPLQGMRSFVKCNNNIIICSRFFKQVLGIYYTSKREEKRFEKWRGLHSASKGGSSVHCKASGRRDGCDPGRCSWILFPIWRVRHQQHRHKVSLPIWRFTYFGLWHEYIVEAF